MDTARPRIGPVRGELPAPCAAAALSSATGRRLDACQRVLERNHGLRPLDTAVTPAILTSLADLGFHHALARHAPHPTFGGWAARAAPGAYLVVVPGHVLAADVVHAPDGRRTVRVADNGEVCTPCPAAPGHLLDRLPVHESIRCLPAWAGTPAARGAPPGPRRR